MTATLHSQVQLDENIPADAGLFSLNIGEEILNASCILRRVIGRRVVLKAVWRGEIVVAKVFFGKRARVSYQRELLGQKFFKQANILSPALLWQGEAKIPGVMVLVFTYIETTSHVNQILHSDDKAKIFKLLKQAQLIIAEEHKHGLIQNDLHFQNFLITEKNLYAIDAADLRKKTVLSEAQCLDNLALLYAQLWARHQDLIEPAFTDYCQLRGWQLTRERLQSLRQAYQRRWYQRITRAKARILRNSSEVTCRHDVFQACCYISASAEIASSFCDFPNEFLQSAAAITLKRGRTCTVFLLTFAKSSWIVKRYNIKNIWHRISRLFCMSRARRSWINAHTLKLLGIPASSPIAFVEKKFLFFKGLSYFVAEYLPGVLLSNYFVGEKANDELVVDKVISLLQQLHGAGVLHRDLKASNFVVNNKEVSLIDLDAMRLISSRKKFLVLFKKDIQRFLANWKNKPELLALFVKKLTAVGLYDGY